ncbi:hypothetical protein L1987_50689 [Smallanthus sonchifolius]|uniref:Uncharacterized protein n=1 Tax=Smallanthus sonchifolius TaxID=185202 RepID=A0ACB9ENP0_9ASTR|nr:hypothetical protein L1987_50689 [Smallanthus sonchifolius]
MSLLQHHCGLLSKFLDRHQVTCSSALSTWRGRAMSLSMSMPWRIDALLRQFHNVKFVTLNVEFLKPLVSHKARALANAVKAQKLMASFQVMLEKEKANIESNRTGMDQGKTPMASHEADAHDQGTAPVERMQLHFKRKLTQMKSCLEDVGIRIDEGRKRTCYIISQLRDIEVLLMKDLPTSMRDELQACFSSLCVEVDIVVKKILHHMNIPQVHLSDCFNELATTSLRSS